MGPGELHGFEPIYQELPGWRQEIRSVRSWEALPAEARAYILKIEALSGATVRLVSVGPERDQVVENS
jgi:adenylosuccinate synthase